MSLFFGVLLLVVSATISTPAAQMNIILILADDMGFNDVSFHGSTQFPTPNIDRLAEEGLIFSRFYTQPICTPSRAALMTGKYPFKIGMQGEPIRPGEPWGLPLKEKIMPQYLKELGYSTHMVGKWHLGDHQKAYYPTHRGFDTFLGTTSGVLDYYDYTAGMQGYSLYNGTEVLRLKKRVYATDLFASWAEDLIVDKSKQNKPFFLYFAPNAPRAAPNPSNPFQTTDRCLNKPEIQAIPDLGRRKYAAMVQALDEAVGRIHNAVLSNGLERTTVIWFLSDNGGPIPQPGTFGTLAPANNWPLRGSKRTLWEGGVRVPAVLWGPSHSVNTSSQVLNELMHITDLLPTIISQATSGNQTLHKLGKGIDGLDQWELLWSRLPLKNRSVIPLDINNEEGAFGLISGKYKMIRGSFFNGSTQGNKWTRPPGTSAEHELRNSTGASVDCGFSEGVERTPCDPGRETCLFDLENDPCELNNIASKNADQLEIMMLMLRQYNESYVAPINKPFDPASNPALHGGVWVPWLDKVVTQPLQNAG